MQKLFLVNLKTRKFIFKFLIDFSLGQSNDHTDKKTELKVTQRLRLVQHKFEELEEKLRKSVTNALSNVNGQSSPANDRKPTNAANQAKFAILVTSPKARNANESSQRKSNGRANSPNHPLSSDENDERSQSKKNTEDEDDDSLSRLISYLVS